MTNEVDARRERVLAALCSAGSDGVSGQLLAEQLGCSRAAIHRHVETLRRNGVAVDGVHEGYRLGEDADPVVASLVEPLLRPPLAGPVRWTHETGSTNDDAVAAARAGAAEGLVIGTDLQTAGRGRRGREWTTRQSEAVLFSVVLRPPIAAMHAGMVPLIVAVSVACALGESARIVWPNDVLIDDTKVCGILCESAADEAGVSWLVAGIGVNVSGAPELDGARWQAGATRPSGVPSRRGELIVAILRELSARYATWLAEGPAQTLAEFARRDRLVGSGVTVRLAGHDVVGTAAGVDDVGQLRVVTAAGEVALAAGEVVRVERA